VAWWLLPSPSPAQRFSHVQKRFVEFKNKWMVVWWRVFCFVFVLQYWGLNSGPQASLPLEPLCQPFLILGIFEIESLKLFAQIGLELRSS
jgi:hypothetical protein